jgi:hypothetical protein
VGASGLTHEFQSQVPPVPPDHRHLLRSGQWSGRQESLRTRDRAEAKRLFAAYNEAHEQPAINLQIARAYLTATDPSS